MLMPFGDGWVRELKPCRSESSSCSPSWPAYSSPLPSRSAPGSSRLEVTMTAIVAPVEGCSYPAALSILIVAAEIAYGRYFTIDESGP